LWYSNAIVIIVTDLIIAALPVRFIWSLQIEKRQKIALVGVLTIGWFVCVISIIRLYILVVFFEHQDDPAYYGAPNAYWSSIEMNLAIVCASLPALKPLIVKIIPGFSSSHASGSGETAPSRRRTANGLARIGSARPTFDERIELGSIKAFNSTSDHSVYGTHQSASKQYEQHDEECGQVIIGDSESQHDLVARPASVLEKR
jgi:hypothetical protein